jgi:hypothetical protein
VRPFAHVVLPFSISTIWIYVCSEKAYNPNYCHSTKLVVHGEARETKIDTMKVGADFVISEELEDEISYPYFDTEKDVYYSIEFDL